MKSPIKTVASITLFLLVGFASIFVAAELFAFFMHFADWTYATFRSLSFVLTIAIGLPLTLMGLLSIWAAIAVATKHWRNGLRTMPNNSSLHG